METTAVKPVLPKNADAKTLGLKHQLFLKKYKTTGKLISEIVEEDPSYILWAHENVAYIKFTDEVIKKLTEVLAQGTRVNFVFDEAELKEHSDVINSVASGLDTYGNEGIRQLHGVSNDVNVHKSLDYFRRLSRYLQQEIKPGGKLGQTEAA